MAVEIDWIKTSNYDVSYIEYLIENDIKTLIEEILNGKYIPEIKYLIGQRYKIPTNWQSFSFLDEVARLKLMIPKQLLRLEILAYLAYLLAHLEGECNITVWRMVENQIRITNEKLLSKKWELEECIEKLTILLKKSGYKKVEELYNKYNAV